MSIDFNLANNQAAQLRAYADQLRSAKNDLYKYKDTLVSAWRGTEAKSVIASIDAQTAKIDKVIKELESLSSNVQSTAASIKRQEEAAAAAARAKAERERREREQAAARARAEAEKAERERQAKAQAQAAAAAKTARQNQINAAQSNYNQAIAEKEKLEKQKTDIEYRIKKAPLTSFFTLQAEKARIIVLLDEAKKKVEEALKALNAAKR
ncbi:MAG: WXG100 family type VII secretion target [Clostridia bacterium]|nr:WXG100 family type VII secretion target [Clostridia bacterium]